MIQEITVPNLAFLGIGWIGKNRMEAIVKENAGRPYIIADTYKPAVEQIKPSYKDSLFYESIDEVISSENLQGVVIATPSALHASQTIEALKKGLAVFCQKPLGRNSAEVKEAVGTAKKYNKLLGVDLSYRYTKAFEALKLAVDSGEIGDVYSAELVFHNAYGPDKPWFYDLELSGGGCVMDLGIHLADLALFTFGFPDIKSVSSNIYSKGKRINPNENCVEDFAAASVEFATGQSARLACSWNLSAGCDAIIEVSFYGTKGGISFKNINGSFYDFTTELYHGTKKDILVMPPDDWSGRVAVEWSKMLAVSSNYNNNAEEFIKSAELIDKIYGRQIE